MKTEVLQYYEKLYYTWQCVFYMIDKKFQKQKIVTCCVYSVILNASNFIMHKTLQFSCVHSQFLIRNDKKITNKVGTVFHKNCDGVRNKWVSDCCLMPTQQFFSYIMSICNEMMMMYTQELGRIFCQRDYGPLLDHIKGPF